MSNQERMLVELAEVVGCCSPLGDEIDRRVHQLLAELVPAELGRA